ncbi:PAS domain S-box protein [uncultured Desulfosarcina sp.]|uniref:PAS domain S-box protein n=1 Tax=uncultured Desulfosarcina sp. TaxID=218289 RepID=UPI0029C8EC27|nr:PAS domain S-box protein [uncultured Desulfosarcina sp.]
MSIRKKIITTGAVIFFVFVCLSLMNIWTHRAVLSNQQTRDAVDKRLSDIQEFERWKSTTIQMVSEAVATGHVHAYGKEPFSPHVGPFIQEGKLLEEAGKSLVDLIAEKKSTSGKIEKTFERLRIEINDLYYRLDEKITAVLAKDQFDQVLGKEASEKRALAQYVLKSLNQLTLVFQNSFISRSFTEKDRDLVAKNRRFLSSQLHLIDPDGSIDALFEKLFAQFEFLDALTLKSRTSLEGFDARIEQAKAVFEEAVKSTEVQPMAASAQSDLDEANRRLEEASGLSLTVVVVFLFFVPLFLITIGIFGLDTIIVDPITELMQAMKHVETGNFDVTAPVSTQDEIGKLASAFNVMAKEIKTKIAEMTHLNHVLQKSEEKFRLYMENTHDGVLIVDDDFKFEYVNSQMSHILGYPLDEIIGQDYRYFLDKESVRLVAERHRLRRKGVDVPSRYEFTIVRKNGEKRNVEISVGVTKDSNGNEKSVGTLLDTTDRRIAEQEAQHLRNQLVNIINSMPSILVGVDSDGKVTQWNKTTQRCTGISASEAVGKSLPEVFPQMTSEMEKIKKSVETKETFQELSRHGFLEDGSGYEDLTIYPLTSGGVQGAVIRIDDVTEKVRMQEMMIQNEKMLSVGGLAAGMAHEINNPLAGMIQTAGVIKNRLTRTDLPVNCEAADSAGTSMQAIVAFMERRGIPRMLGNMLSSGQRAAEIVSNMLSFARKSESAFSTHNLGELIDQTVDLAGSDYDLKKKYDFRKVEILREYAADVPPVLCEASKIQQVLLNLLRNGAEAMQEMAGNGFQPRFILRLDHEKKTGKVRIELEDNGPGMDEATCKRVFEPFFTTKPTGKGTGLGLSVSYFIVTENHGGEMKVESVPGKGTTFIVKLPLEPKEPTHQHASFLVS